MDGNGELPTGSAWVSNVACGSIFKAGVTDGEAPSGSTKGSAEVGKLTLAIMLDAFSCVGVDFSLGDSIIFVIG